MEVDTMLSSPMNFERTPLTPPVSEKALQLWMQLPAVLKQRGFGYYMSQHDDDFTMTDAEFYWSFAANYYYFNYDKDSCSFTEWQNRIKTKVVSYQEGVTPEQAATIIKQVETEIISFAEGAKQLFTRRQMMYYGW
jgi:hypothetical protein